MLMRRSRAREVALQLLFQFDFNTNVERDVIDRFVRERLRDPQGEAFCRAIYDGAVAQRAAIDEALAAAAENWRVPRMPAVDRNVLRIGAFELLFHPEVPAAAVINEAIELARRFGSKDSPAFVNGVLDKIAQSKGAENKPPTANEAPPVSTP